MSKRKNCHEDQVLFKKINPLIQRLKAFYHGFINMYKLIQITTFVAVIADLIHKI